MGCRWLAEYCIFEQCSCQPAWRFFLLCLMVVPASSQAQSSGLPHPAVWRATQAGVPPAAGLPCGHAALAAYLPGACWPYHCLIEFLVARPGCGEVALLQPALVAAAGTAPIVLVQPPHPPLAQAWQAGLPAGARVWWLTPGSAGDALWAADQAVRSAGCAVVLAWLPQVSRPGLRRLQLAAQESRTLLVVMRPAQAQAHSSPAALRLLLQPEADALAVRFHKMRGARPLEAVRVPVWRGLMPVAQPAVAPEMMPAGASGVDTPAAPASLVHAPGPGAVSVPAPAKPRS